MRRVLISVLAFTAILVSQAGPSARVGEVEQPVQVRVELRDARSVEELNELGINLDGVFDGWARAYILKEERTKLQKLGWTVSTIPDDGPQKAALARAAALQGTPRAPEGGVPAAYHTYTTLTSDLQQIAADHPGIVRLTSIGQSVQGRELWMVKISNSPDTEENEPEFAYVSSMHGDEVVGKEMMVNLLNYLTDNYGTDSRVTDLIDTTEIWIMPSMNPDGTELGQRSNANGFDLNRNFPDQFVDATNTPNGRQAETQAIMNWLEPLTIDLSANFHGGAVVTNYPFDSNPAGSSTFSPTPSPDHTTFVSISRTYADNNFPMSQQNLGSFDNGITNGADWYSINGGMQDWHYVWYGGFEVLMELSAQKWPAASTLPGYWADNQESLLAYMERVHDGVRGLVTDADTGLPLAATIQVDGNPFIDYTDPDVGDFHRLLSPGTYTLTFRAPGRETVVVPNVVVVAGVATAVDVALGPMPVDLQAVAARTEDGGDNIVDPGELADLAVMLENFGRSATGIEARLIPTGWDATLTRDQAVYPDIALGQSQESSAPYYQMQTAPSIPEGRRLGFAVQWSAAQGSGISEPFFLNVGLTQVETAASSDIPKQILGIAGATANSLLVIPAGQAIGNLTGIEVSIDLTHTYIGDLEIDLESPQGTTVRLHNRSGGSSNDIVGTYGVDLIPAQSLSSFLGEDSQGTWTLRIVDQAFGDQGFLNNWSLIFEGRPAETTTPELRFRDLSEDNGKVFVDWWSYPGLTEYRVYRSTDPSGAAAFVDITGLDLDPSDTRFEETATDPLLFYLVTGVGPNGEGPKGHFGE